MYSLPGTLFSKTLSFRLHRLPHYTFKVTLSQVITELFPFLIFDKIELSGHISKRIEGNLMKLDTLIEGNEGNCGMQEL